MNLNELEKQIIVLESDETLPQTIFLVSSIPYLKQDIEYVKAQLEKLG
jgi:hypothetical protein